MRKDRRRGLSWWMRSLLVTCAAALMGVTAASPAWADVVAENSGVRGRANWTWNSNGTSLNNITMGVRDLLCDNNDVYVQLRIYRSDGYTTDTNRNYDGRGCGTAANWSGLNWQSQFYIRGVVVIACVDDFGSNRCAYSPFHDNPYV